MTLLQLQRATKQFGTRTLFDGASFSINENEHVGVIGPNGAGKTTLFKILVGQESMDSGQLIKAVKLKIGYLEQESTRPWNNTAEYHLNDECTIPLWDLKKLGLELGLSEEKFKVPFQSLSGGYRMRFKLLSLIGKEPNLMLLDEPTNFLDLESILALEGFLREYKGAFLLISHDREFLKRTTAHTLEVEAGEITKFPGHIDDYFEQKAMLREVLKAQAQSQDLKRKSIQEFIDRFGAKATKARQAQSRMKALEKMDPISVKELPTQARIRIPPPIHTGVEALRIRNAELGYPDKTVIQKLTLSLPRGAHLGVVGFNGAGKSTLLKSIAARIPLLGGAIELGYQVSLSYFAQHVAEDLDPNHSVLEALSSKSHRDISSQEILNLAGSLLFSGDAVHKKISILSGGEKSRVALGQILLQKSPLLLLDEPTNHLDFETVEALTTALERYEGAIIVVSHDRGFIARVATKILEIRDGTAEVYPGNYEDYLWSLEKGALKERFENQNESVADKPTPASDTDEKFNFKRESKKWNAEKRDIEKRISRLESALEKKSTELQQLNNDLLTASGAAAQTLSRSLGHCGAEIQKLEEELLEDMERLEALKLKFQT